MNAVQKLLAAQRDIDAASTRCCIALSVMLDCHRDDCGLTILYEGNNSKLLESWGAALLEAREALAARHAAVLALEAACRGIGAEPMPRDL